MIKNSLDPQYLSILKDIYDNGIILNNTIRGFHVTFFLSLA